jgi:hypothetical protein
VLIVLLLVVAPGAALGRLLFSWVPERVAVSRLNHAVTRQSSTIETTAQEGRRLQQELERLQQALDTDVQRARWLPHRDRDLVFDRLATVFADGRVVLELLTLAEPTLYCAASRANLLACERVTVRCAGDYAALTTCLDRLATVDLPVRVRHLDWGRSETGLRVGLELEVPFVPDPPLAKTLADAAGLVETVDEP